MTFEEAVSYLREINLLSMTLRFLVATICGGIIGFTRGRRQHAAGLRTHLLVCIGSASIMIVSQFYIVNMGMPGDIVRMPAQVVSGIGFLGAGSIIVTGKHSVRGLTTAAGLWASACMGLAAGAGYYECAILMSVLIYIALVTLNKLDATYVKSSKIVVAYIEMDASTRMSVLLKGLSEIGLEACEMEQFGRDNADFCGYKAELEIVAKGVRHQDVIGLIEQIDGVLFVEEMKA